MKDDKLFKQLCNEAANKISNASKIIITAGAGIGVDSGMPDFRGKDGFWNTFNPFRDKFTFQDCANPKFLREFPLNFWGFYGYRINMYRDIQPHDGFKILKKIIQQKNITDYFIVTSNVDGHFQKSGFSEDRIYEIHGRINYLQCDWCKKIISADSFQFDIDFETINLKSELPQCNNCIDQTLRPNILMFNDYQFNELLQYNQEDQFEKFQKNLKSTDQIVIIEVGAGTAIPSIRYLGESFIFAKNLQTSLIRINLYESQFDSQSNHVIKIPATSLKTLQEIDNLLIYQ